MTTTALPSDTREFLGMGEGTERSGFAERQPSFGRIETGADTPPQVDLDAYDEQTRNERAAIFRAAGEELFRTDVSKLDDAGAWGLYRAVTRSMFGLSDEDGSVAFGKRASKDPRQNIDMLRRFVKGEYSLIEDPEYVKWRQMDEEAKFRYALENETTGNMLRSKMKGERGTSPIEVIAAGDMSSFVMPWTDEQRAAQEADRKIREDAIRNADYDTMDDDKKAAYRADVIADYDKKLSRRQTLATFLQFSQGLSDRASYLLAKSFNDGTLDAQVMTTIDDPEEQKRVLSAFSLMRGDQKSGHLLGISADFTDGTAMNRVQLGLYGFQQSVLGLFTDTWDVAKDAALWTYAKTRMSESERAEFFKWWDAQARAEQAMKQELPEAEGFVGEMFQGFAENFHWFIPYTLLIDKGGKIAKGARAAMARAGLQKEVAETVLASAKAGAEASRARWLADVEGAVKAGKGARKVGDFASAMAMKRQLAAVEQYTAALREIPKAVKAARWKDAAGAGMWAAGEASAFSAFASEYISAADAAGISREESVMSAAMVGLINAWVERMYVPGMESTLSPAQLKSMMWISGVRAFRSDGAAGVRKWLASRFPKDAAQMVRVSVSETLEEGLQQMAIEHGKAFDEICQKLRKNGQATLANEWSAFWESMANTLPRDYATFIDTAADSLASSVGFGVTSVANMKARQHFHNVMTRHANRRAGAEAADTMLNLVRWGEDPSRAIDYDAGVVDMIQRAANVRSAMERHWQGEGGEAQENPHRFEEAITAARRAFRDPQTSDVVGEVAKAAGLDAKTAEVLTQYLRTEAEAAAFSPTVRALTSLDMSLADIDEKTIKTVLPGYVEGSFASDPENGVYSGKVKLADGTERTIAYRVGDVSEVAMAQAQENAKLGSDLGKSFDARMKAEGRAERWAALGDAERYDVAVRSVNGWSSGKGGVFELTDAKGRKVRVNADDVIYLASGRLADIGYGAAATQGTARHETFHSLWRFARASMADEDVQTLAKTLGVDVTQDGWEADLDEAMAVQMEQYASGHYVSHAVSSRFDKMLDGWAGKIIDFFGKFGQRDEVTDPNTGKPYKLKDLYDKILRGELGTGALGVELAKLPAQPAEAPAKESAAKSSMPVEVTDADRAAAEAEAQEEAQAEAAKEEPPAPATPTSPAPTVTTVPVPVATAENPADASTPNQRYYRIGLPNSNVKLVGRLEVRDVDTGLVTSTDADYHDRGNQNRDDKSEESRSLVQKIGANPDPLQVGTVQPIASNGVVWMLPNGDVIIGNHRVNGVRLGYEKGTAGNLEKFVREDAAKRGIEIGESVKRPLLVFVLERIESPDGKADVHEVVRLANESQNRGFNVREQAANDAKILIDNNLLPRMAFRADGRIDETKSGDAIGKFRQETGAQGMIAEDGSLTEEGQTRIQNAALAVLLGGEGSGALLQKIMANAGRLDMQNELRALMKMTPELMSLAEAKPGYDLRAPLAEALQLFTEWRDKDETLRVEKGKTRHDWRETKNGQRVRGISWEQFMSQGDMFRQPSEEAKILGALLARAEAERSFDREDVESAVGKKRAIDLIADYLTDYIKNARAVNTETDDMFGSAPATRAEVMAAQWAKIAKPSAPSAPASTAPAAATPKSSAPTVTPSAVQAAPASTQAAPAQPAPAPASAIPGAKSIKSYQVDASGRPTTAVRNLPPGAYGRLRAPFDVRRPPAPSEQDKAGRGLGISNPPPTGHADIFPHFQGDKTDMAARTSQAIRKAMSPAERAHYTTVVDYFGGGGCWGLYHALENFPNVRTLVVNEFDPDRLEKIRLLHEIDGQVADEAALLLETKMEELRAATNNSSSPQTISSNVPKVIDMAALDRRQRGALQAFCDCAATMLATVKDAQGNPINDTRLGVEKALAALREDGRKAKAAADEFKARHEGAEIRYVQGDAEANAATMPHGGDVMAIADPPYYLTADYQQNTILGLDRVPDNWSYVATRDFLKNLVDRGDGIVYTDEAWWFKESYAPDTQGDLFGGERKFDREQRTLLDIIDMLDRFDVAGRVVGRQEVLGIHNGNATEKANGEANADTRAENGENGTAVRNGQADDEGGERGVRPPVLGVAAQPEAEGGDAGTAREERGRDGAQPAAGRAGAAAGEPGRPDGASGVRERPFDSEAAVANVADAILDATSPDGRATPDQTAAADSVARYSIAGRQGAERLGLKGAAEAEAMEKNGADREHIWRTTGWWRGKDGKWRVEIPDVPDIFDSKNWPEGKRTDEQPEVKAKIDEFQRRIKDLHPAEELHEIQDLQIQEAELHDLRLGDFLKGHPLLKAYPELAEWTVNGHVPPGTGTKAATYVSQKRINIGSNFSQTNEARSIFLHELQHAIQAIEGFAPGLTGKDVYHASAGEVEARNVQARLAMPAEERAATPPWKTEDVPQERQITRYSVGRVPFSSLSIDEQRASMGLKPGETMWSKHLGRNVSNAMQSVLDRLNHNEDVSIVEIKSTPEWAEAETLYDRLETDITADLAAKGRIAPGGQADTSLYEDGDVRTLPDGTTATTKEIHDRIVAELTAPRVPDPEAKGKTYEVARDRQAFIVIGWPAAGKSSVFADALCHSYRARLVDSDEVKSRLPEFNDGLGANAVHEESKDILRQVFEIALQRGENIVGPILGKTWESIKKHVSACNRAGYEVHLLLNDVPRNVSKARMITRYLLNGRFLDPKLVDNGDPKEAYNEARLHERTADAGRAGTVDQASRTRRGEPVERGSGLGSDVRGDGAQRLDPAAIASFTHRSNDVARGEPPIDIESTANAPRFSVLSSGRYYGTGLREIAHGLKQGDPASIEQAADLMARNVPPKAVLVPMPGHEGPATTMLPLARAIAARVKGATVVDALVAEPHESNYTHKQRMHRPVKVVMHRTDAKLPKGRPVMVVDNVIASGATYRAAQAVIPDADLLTLADAGRGLETRKQRERMRYSVFMGGRGAARLSRGKGIEKHLETLIDAVTLAEKLGRKPDSRSRKWYTPEARDEIYAKTGWWLGTDGQWRVEIPDMKPKTVESLEPSNYNGEDADSIHLQSLVSNGRLFKAYPDLKNVRVWFVDPDSDTMDGIAGSLDGYNIVMSWDDLTSLDPDDGPIRLTQEGLETLTHEVQHFIQFVEEFATGGSPRENGPRNYARLAGEVEARNAERRIFGPYGTFVSARQDEAMRRRMMATGFAPWQTEDVPTLQQLISRGDGKQTDISGKPVERFSVEAPRSRLAYPSLLNTLSDEELLSAAVASRIALGKSDKVSDRSVKVSTVQKLVRRLHPDWDTTKVGVEAQRVMSGAQKFARRIREDLDRGVSESLVLEHLPDAMRSTFGAEMRQEARQGARLGAFGARANAEIGERQARIIEDAVRNETGFDASAIENYYGINLSETIMHLRENRLAEKPPPGGTGQADEEGSAPDEESAGEAEQPAAEIDAKVKAVVKDILAASGRQADTDEQNRQNRKNAAGRDAENEKAMGGESEGEEGSVPDEESSGEGDFLAAAAAKEGLNLENPRHLARFVAELARRQYVKEHHLALNADVWRDLVAVQFLRKTAQSVYAKLCRDLTYSRSRETAMQRIAKLDAVPTVAGLLSEMEFVGALINAQRIRDTQKQLCEKLDLFLRENFGAQGRFKPDKEEGKRKVSAEAELRARYMRHAMWLTPDAAAEEARQLQETLDALSVDFKDAGRDRDQSREFIETIRKLNVLREFGGLRYKPVGEIEAAVQWWQDFARGESDDIVREMSDRDIRTKKAAHLLAVAFADPKRKTIREGDSMSDKLNRFITGHMGFISLLQDCMRYASDADAAAVKDIIDYIAREIQKSGDRSDAEKRRHNDAFHSAVESIYGKSFDAVMKDMMAPDERFANFMGVVGGKRVTPTRGRAMQLLVSLLQEGRKVEVEDEENPGKTKFVWEGGYHDNIVKHKREGQAAEIMRLLTPQDMNMLKWLGQWYENNRSDLSDVCHSLFGIGVYAELPNYFPVKMQLEKQGLEKGDGVGWTIFPKALTPRVRNERDFDTSADIFSMWAARMEEAAQWKHHAQLGLEMRGIFGRAELREAVRANHGASVDDLMQGFITDIMAGHGAYDRSTAGVQYFSDQIRGWTALCALGGNVGVMLKQTTSIPAFGFEIGLVNTAKYIVNAFTPDGMAAMLRIWDSEQRQTRWQVGSSEAVRNALNQQNAGLLKRMLQASMITNRVGDVVPALVVGQGIYRDCLARGMSEEDAMAETWSIIERTQQSGRMENQTSIQRRNKLGRIMFQFMSTQQQYLQYEVRAIREVIARPDSVKRWGSLGRAILLNHFILSSAYFWMGELYKACLGQEPPDDELKDWLITCLLGPYGSLVVAGFMCKATLERAIKGYSWKSPSMLPMESFLKNQINDGAKLLEAIFDSEGDTWDNMLDAAGRWMSDSNSVVRDLRKIYRYRVKNEPQKRK